MGKEQSELRSDLTGREACPTKWSGALPPGKIGNTLNQFFSSLLGTGGFEYALPRIPRRVRFARLYQPPAAGPLAL